jgi:hypothetical protein
VVRTVDHRFALNRQALLSAPSKKLSAALRAPCGERANLCVQRLHVDGGLCHSIAAAGAENIGSSTSQISTT